MVEVLDPTTKDDLKECLSIVIRRAYSNDVDVSDTGYDLRYEDPEIPDWDVQIVRMAKSTDREAGDSIT